MMFRRALIYLIRKRKKDYSIAEEYSLFDLVYFFKPFSLIRGIVRTLIHGKPRICAFGKGVKIFGKRNIAVNNYVKIGDRTTLSSLGSNTLISIGKSSSIGAFCKLEVSSSIRRTGKSIIIGDRTGMGDFCQIGGFARVKIGNDTIMGSFVSFHPMNHKHDFQSLLKFREQGVEGKGIVIGNNCWIGAKVTFLDGVTIGDNCVIGAGSVVTKSFESNATIVGVPAKRIK